MSPSADWIGWVATGVFAVSYICRNAATLRRVQAAAAGLWIVYGMLLGAAPVVAANLAVAVMAIVSSMASKRARPAEGSPGPREEGG
jgi:hypothetical protein